MKTIQAIYEDGVFRPTEPVDLPDGSLVLVRPDGDASSETLSPHQSRIYTLLGQSDDTGDPTLSERHDEHQP